VWKYVEDLIPIWELYSTHWRIFVKLLLNTFVWKSLHQDN